LTSTPADVCWPAPLVPLVPLCAPAVVWPLAPPFAAIAPAPDEGTFDEHEKRLIADALAQANNNQSQAARALRIGRDALRYKMKKHGLL
jgi:transcriptional regulator of acetoin/glycerol metabolism